MKILPCPYCNSPGSECQSLDGGTAPETGDILLCVGCGGWQILDGDSVRKPNAEEMAEIAASDEAAYLRLTWAAFDRRRKRKAS